MSTSTLNATSDATPRTRLGSAFSRPAALIGGGAALVALSIAATTMVVRPPASKTTPDGARSAPVALLDAGAQKSSGSVQQATADDPDDAVRPAAPQREGNTAKPAPVHSRTATASPKTAAAAAPARTTASVCTHCGVIEAVTPVKQKGEGTGVGAVGGAVVGGLLGNTMGGGDGRKAMTVLGAVGGGVAGNAIEKNVRATTVYQVRVRMDDGTQRTLTQTSAPAVGAKVTLEGNQIRARG
jgi:outer membrane lipoprotein SlyB